MYARIEGSNILLYGSIYRGDGQWVVSDISKTLAVPGTDVTIHLHTDGGSVFDGNLIFNAIATAKANVNIVIDGLAASMGSIIMLAGKKISMAENGYIMIHAPSGDERGNAKDFENTAKLLRSMEGNFLKKLSAKVGKPEADIKGWIEGNNWFSADEAKEAGLIDEIVDPVFEHSDLSAYQDVNMCASLFAEFNKKPEAQTPTNTSINLKPKKMKLTAKSMTVLGLTADASEVEINAAIERQNDKLAKMEANAAAEKTAKVNALIADAVASGKILAGEKEAWIKDATDNYDLTARMIAKLEGKAVLSGREKTTPNGSTPEGRDNWTFADWRKKDIQGLLELKSSDPQAYAEILKK